MYWLFPSAVTKSEYCQNPADFGRECFLVCVCVCVCMYVCVGEREGKRERESESERNFYRLQRHVFNMNLSI